MDTIPVDN